MILSSRHGLQNFWTIDYASYVDLKKLKPKCTTWIESETEKNIFVECYAIWWKGNIVL